MDDTHTIFFIDAANTHSVNDELQAARQARQGIEQVHRYLLTPTPESLHACDAPLREAIGSLERLEGYLRRGSRNGPRLRSEICFLRDELSAATALLKSAGCFYEGLGFLLGHGPEPVEVQYGADRGRTAVAERRFIVNG